MASIKLDMYRVNVGEKRRTIKAKMVVAVGIGDYTKTNTIMTNIDQYSKFSRLKIQEAINLME